MPVDFTCPHCSNRTVVEDAFTGKSGRCINCGKFIQVPGLDTSTTATSAPIAAATRSQFNSLALMASILAVAAAAAITILILVLAAFKPYVEQAQARILATSCDRNLARLGKAFQAYHQHYGSFPPASVTDKSGKPMHSWRVLILPELGELTLYKKYRFDQPWNSPENLEVSQQMPAVFGCPANPEAIAQNETSYMVIVGKRTAFPGPDQATRSEQFDDGLSQTILVVETVVQGVLWTDPTDLDADLIKYDINGRKGNGIGSSHPDGAHVLMADGSHRFLENDLPVENVRAMSTISQKDAVASDGK